MTQEIVGVLETCWQEIAAGRATVDDCVERYPEAAPLLRVAGWAQAVERPSLAPQARTRIEAQFLSAVESASSVEPRQNVYRLWRWAAAGLALLCIVACLSAAGLAAAANGALPGSPLYPVKLAAEDAWLWRTPDQDKAALHLRLARRRLDEVRALAERGQFDTGALAASTAELEAALVGLEKLETNTARPLLDDLLQAVDEQEKTLAALLTGASLAEREPLTRALHAGNVQRTRALQLLGTFSPPQEPDGPDRATATPGPAARVTIVPSHTPIPASSTPTLAASLTPTDTPPPTALPVWFTPTPEPTDAVTPSPTETSEPTPTLVPLTLGAEPQDKAATATPTLGAEPQDKAATNTPTQTPRPTETARPTNSPTATMTPAPPANQACVRGHGYWKNHLDLWPVSTLLLGDQSYEQNELSAILRGSSNADASLGLARQLIAARLNVAGGADDSAIASTLTAADDWLGNYTSRLPYDVSPASPAGQQATSLADTLEQYNDGVLPDGPPRCP